MDGLIPHSSEEPYIATSEADFINLTQLEVSDWFAAKTKPTTVIQIHLLEPTFKNCVSSYGRRALTNTAIILQVTSAWVRSPAGEKTKSVSSKAE